MKSDKTCPKCKVTRPVSEFAKHRNRHDGLQSVCKPCGVVYRRTTQRPSDLKRRFGITIDDFARMESAQGGVCAICKNPPRTGRPLVVDHDHEAGHVRGLLCDMCNKGLGMFHDSTEDLESAIAYLVAARSITLRLVR